MNDLISVILPVYDIFLHFLHRGRMDKEEIQRMCAVMKEHKKELLPSLPRTRRLRFHLHVNFPSTIRLTAFQKNHNHH